MKISLSITPSIYRWEDQQWIKQKMGLISGGNTGGAAGVGSDGDEESEPMESSVENYSIEYSKSNRSMCKKCSLKIEKAI